LSVCIPDTRSTALEESIMTATYTFDVFSSLDGFGAASGDWTGYWGKQGPELLDHRLALYDQGHRAANRPSHKRQTTDSHTRGA
jgi:hypothetical protein